MSDDSRTVMAKTRRSCRSLPLSETESRRTSIPLETWDLPTGGVVTSPEEHQQLFQRPHETFFFLRV